MSFVFAKLSVSPKVDINDDVVPFERHEYFFLTSVFLSQAVKVREKPFKRKHPPVTFVSLGQSAMKMQRMFGTETYLRIYLIWKKYDFFECDFDSRSPPKDNLGEQNVLFLLY